VAGQFCPLRGTNEDNVLRFAYALQFRQSVDLLPADSGLAIKGAALLSSKGKAIYDVTGPSSVTHEQIASTLSRLSGKSIQHLNVTPDEVEKGLVAAGIPQFPARSVRELDEESSRGYQAVVTPTVTNLTGPVPMSVENFLQATVPAIDGVTRPVRGRVSFKSGL
jgi:hypothetical protein